jgi:uncharacterized protein YcbK (DUF882 family)
LIAAGIDPNISVPKDEAGKPVEAKTVTPVEEKGKEPETVEPVNEKECNITNDYQLSKHYKVKDVLKASSGGKIKAQHGLDACQIATNLKTIMTNVADVAKDKWGSFYITSSYRVAGNPHSLKPPKVSRHELGLAIDFKFSDISTYAEYHKRIQELAKIVACETLILEYVKGSVWIHAELSKSGKASSPVKINTIIGNKRHNGLVSL